MLSGLVTAARPGYYDGNGDVGVQANPAQRLQRWRCCWGSVLGASERSGKRRRPRSCCGSAGYLVQTFICRTDMKDIHKHLYVNPKWKKKMLTGVSFNFPGMVKTRRKNTYADNIGGREKHTQTNTLKELSLSSFWCGDAVEWIHLSIPFSAAIHVPCFVQDIFSVFCVPLCVCVQGKGGVQ